MTNNQPVSSPVIEQVKRLRRAQMMREEAELRRLVDAFAAINEAARKDAETLALKIITDGSTPTAGQLRKMRQYREIIDTVTKELEQYQAFMRVELRSQAGLAITEGERDARILARIAAQGAGIDVGFRAINPRVIEQIVGFLDPKGPLYERLGLLSEWGADKVAETILQGIARGLNPRTTAAMLTKTLTDGVTDALGMALTDSMRMMRTVQLWSYREANRASYLANQDVVTGWIWWAELDGDCCASCWAMHGTEHALDETLDDHHNGRCAMLPMVVGAPNDITPGADAFEALSETEQRAILGPGKFDAWKGGRFTLADIPTQREDYVYGNMRQEKTLKELTGDE